MAEATQSTRTDSASSGSAGTQTSSEATQSSQTAHDQSREGHEGKHVHHGRTPAAWAGVAIAMLAFLLGGYAVLAQNWTLFWISCGLCVVALIVAGVLQKMGYGAD
jgi:hypothetical protein